MRKAEKSMRNIIFIGMPAVGKSTVGVVVAKRLGLEFIDTDLLIQKQEKKLQNFYKNAVLFNPLFDFLPKSQIFFLFGDQIFFIFFFQIFKYGDFSEPSVFISQTFVVQRQNTAFRSAGEIKPRIWI